jgi:hypothetical protein
MSRAVLDFSRFTLPFMVGADRERAEDRAVLHRLVPSEARHIGSAVTEVSGWTSWRVDDHFYLLPLKEGEFQWALFRITWDDNYGHYSWSGDARARGIDDPRVAAARMARALFRRWKLDLRRSECRCYREFLECF